VKPRYAIAIGLAVALAGSAGAIVFSRQVGSEIHDHDTAVITSMIVSFVGGILSGTIGAVVSIWLWEK
jgi:hypothetical protein